MGYHHELSLQHRTDREINNGMPRYLLFQRQRAQASLRRCYHTARELFASFAVYCRTDTDRVLGTLLVGRLCNAIRHSLCDPVSTTELCGLPEEKWLPERAHDCGALNRT